MLVGTGALFCIVWDRDCSWGDKKGCKKAQEVPKVPALALSSRRGVASAHIQISVILTS